MSACCNRDSVGDTCYRDGNGAVRRSAIAELAQVVGTPAFYGTAVQYRASVDLTCSDGDSVTDGRNRDGTGTRCRGAIAEIAVDIAAPAPNGAIV